jgi:hypothetical protein
MKGQKLTKEHYDKIVKANRLNGIKRRGIIPKNLDSLNGENHWNWKGGIDTPGHRAIVKNKRNFLFAQISGSHTNEEWLALQKRFGFNCVCCYKKKKLTKDHIIPVGHKSCTNNISNIQPLCLSCNVKKGSKIINYQNK